MPSKHIYVLGKCTASQKKCYQLIKKKKQNKKTLNTKTNIFTEQ